MAEDQNTVWLEKTSVIQLKVTGKRRNNVLKHTKLNYWEKQENMRKIIKGRVQRDQRKGIEIENS